MGDQKAAVPAGLEARGAALWASVVGVYELSAVERELLAEACRVADTLETLRAVIAAEGATSTGSKGQRVVHPAVGEARQQQLVLGRLLGQLDLPDEEDGQVVPSSASLRGRKAAEARWRREIGRGA